ncbi:MAG: SEL1-like repeat protein [Pseudomonadales bacterium]|nr:SEL1-like repeat protein [Pseudomonadales bacterium]
MRRLVSFFLLFAGLPAFADFESAASAYRSKNYPAAYAEFMELAQSGDARAQSVIAMMYKYGEAVPLDLTESFKWYMKAAELGYAPAQYNVGEMYADGKGVEADRGLALQWLRKAAVAGFERANEKLADLNAEPVESETTVDPAVPWSKQWNFRLPNALRYGSSPAAASDASPWRAQVGAMASAEAANRLWRELVDDDPETLGAMSPTIRQVSAGTREIYRVQVGNFGSHEEASAFCDRLTRRVASAGCLPTRQ